MKKSIKTLAILVGLTTAGTALACSQDGRDGFLPENNFYIPANQKSINGITEQEFNKAIDEVEEVYAPIVSSMGGKLNIERNWDDGTVNAYASQSGKNWKVAMFGGLARHATTCRRLHARAGRQYRVTYRFAGLRRRRHVTTGSQPAPAGQQNTALRRQPTRLRNARGLRVRD